ncbi:MAG: 5-bromo-4-chloroindolyl phosphate hydrolysis family protein [Lachnospiraceae bacterium]|nr:5-bromo-4-chloroindolyl phosphate hydrolysis family protein [Lachnospiraceae bacterium]
MKHRNSKGVLMTVCAVSLTLLLFSVLLFGLKWNLLLCMLLAIVFYIAMTLLLEPERRIGRVKLSALNNGELLHEKLGEAGEDYERIRRAGMEIRDDGLSKKVIRLQDTAYSILCYLTENPNKISSARRYIDYYQETAANVLENYVMFQKAGLDTKEAEQVKKNTLEAVDTLNAAFCMQFEKLMQNELMDMEADLNLLKQTLYSEGYEEIVGAGKQECDS